MTTLDDKATEFEELRRADALKMRKPDGPEACGACLNCGAYLGDGLRWCDQDCRDDWQARRGVCVGVAA